MGIKVRVLLCRGQTFAKTRSRFSVLVNVQTVVGATIRRLREQRGVSQETFAHQAGLDRSFYGKIERGIQNVSLTTLCAVAHALEVHPSELLKDINTANHY